MFFAQKRSDIYFRFTDVEMDTEWNAFPSCTLQVLNKNDSGRFLLVCTKIVFILFSFSFIVRAGIWNNQEL